MSSLTLATRVLLTLALVLALPAFAQQFEVGAGGGASIYNSQSITGGAVALDAKFKPGYSFSGYFGQVGARLGGEVRYAYASNQMELSGGGKNFTMGGRTQSVHYDVLVFFGNKEAKTRPYVLAGGGMRQYTGTGDSNALQPFLSTAVLTATSEWKPLITGGGGVRVALSPRTSLRAEVRAYVTQSPTKIVTPVTGSLSGWIFDIVPTVSFAYVW